MAKNEKKPTVKDQVFAFDVEVKKNKPAVEAAAEEPVVKEDSPQPSARSNSASWSGTQGIKGAKLPRMNLAFHPETYEKIKRSAIRNGMTYSEFLTELVNRYADNIQP